MSVVIASSQDAFRLMMEGSEALTDITENGMRIDVPYLDRVLEESAALTEQIKVELRGDDIYRIWQKVFGTSADIGSRDQLSRVLYQELGIEVKSTTRKGKAKTDVEAFEGIDLPFVARWVTLQKLIKARSTYLLGIRRETVDGILRANFLLNIANTFRSSCRDPNIQNQPIRDPKMAKLIRRAFIPRDDHVLVETDYGALEFRGAAMFWKDPAMVAYASDPTLDIHRDMASECYLLERDDVSKPARTFAKNKFVFPVLYGSYWGNCAPHLWGEIERNNIKSKAGVPLYEHLKQKGITRLGDKKDTGPGTYTGHVKQVEKRFNDRFSYWSSQKQVWWESYLKRGWFPMATGFVCQGIYTYNDLMNYPIQGSSFHCTLWSLIQINRELKRRRMRSMVVGQIHDSIIGDVHRSELDDYLELVVRIMTKDIRDHWRWINVPLEVEAEVGERNWFEKKAYSLVA